VSRSGSLDKLSTVMDAETYLASTPASFITGSIIRVDGGMIPSI
jgi:NAD(P)-dependent dehydrogenase (short-subunit alcohol dehydrogenase family)